MLSLNKKNIKNHYINHNLKRNKEVWTIKNTLGGPPRDKRAGRDIGLGKRVYISQQGLRYYRQFGNFKRTPQPINLRGPYMNYSFRRNLYYKRIHKNYYQNYTENSLVILLIRSHWAISIKEAKHFIKNNYVEKINNKIIAKDLIIPILFKNILIHKKFGSKVPHYLKRSVNTIFILPSPSQSPLLP